MRKKNKLWIKKIAESRINLLFKLAEKEFHKNPERSNRYVFIARKISMRYRVKIPAKYKSHICKHCHSYLVQGVNARTRLHKSTIITTCLLCGKQTRKPFK